MCCDQLYNELYNSFTNETIDNRIDRLISQEKIKYNLKVEDKYIFLDQLFNDYTALEKMAKIFTCEIEYKIIVPIKSNTIELDLLKKIDEIGLDEFILFLKINNTNELIDLINASELVIDISTNNQDNINPNLVLAVFLNRPILCNNIEINCNILSNYPHYYNDNINIDSIIKNRGSLCADRESIIRNYLEKIRI